MGVLNVNLTQFPKVDEKPKDVDKGTIGFPRGPPTDPTYSPRCPDLRRGAGDN